MIRVNRKIISNIFIYLIILLDFGFFYILKFPNWFHGINSTSSKTLIGILIFLYMGTFLLKKMKIGQENYSVWVILIFFALSDAITFIRYNLPLKTIILWIVQKSIVFFAIPLYKKYIYDGGVERFLDVCTIFSFVWSVIGIIENIIYKSFGRHVLRMYLGEYFMRNGSVRVLLNGICHISILYIFAQTYTGKENWRYRLIGGILLGYVFVIDGTRTVQLGLPIIIAVTYALVPNKKRRLSKIIITSVMLIMTYFFIQSEIFNAFLYSFVSTSNNAMSMSAKIRYDEWNYFIKKIGESPILGIGDILPGMGCDYILNGGHSNYYTEDIGIIGSMGRFGLNALFIYLVLFYREIKTLSKMSRTSFEYSFCFSIFLYTVFSLISLSFLDIQRLLYLAIILSIFNYYLRSVDTRIKVVNF